jgi:hypothetical protein
MELYLGYTAGETKWKQSTWWHWLDKHVYRHVQDRVKVNAPVQGIRQLDGNDKMKQFRKPRLLERFSLHQRTFVQYQLLFSKVVPSLLNHPFPNPRKKR